jgi:AraC-like DNA-binding protein
MPAMQGAAMSIYNRFNQYAVPVAYYALALPEFSMQMHSHHRCEIMCLLSGQCEVTVGQQRHRLKERQFIFIDQDVPHRLLVDATMPCVLLNLEFTCGCGNKGVDLNHLAASHADFRQFLDRHMSCLVMHDSGKVGYALKDLIDEMEKKNPVDDLLQDVLFTRLLIELARSLAADTTASGISHVRRAMQYIVEHLYEEICVLSVSRAVGVNHTYLQKLWSEHYHCGIMGTVNTMRLDHAAFLLRNSSMSIIDIAYHIGYNSRQHFSHSFLKQFQMRPLAYRKLNSRRLDPDTAGSQRLVTPDGRHASVAMTPGV